MVVECGNCCKAIVTMYCADEATLTMSVDTDVEHEEPHSSIGSQDRGILAEGRNLPRRESQVVRADADVCLHSRSCISTRGLLPCSMSSIVYSEACCCMTSRCVGFKADSLLRTFSLLSMGQMCFLH